MKEFWAMVKARTMEFIRDRGTFFWNLLFPVIMVIGFSFAFSGDGETMFKVGYLGTIPSSSENAFMAEFMGMKEIDFIDYNKDEYKIPKDEILKKLRFHQIDMFVDFNAETYYLNQESPKANVLTRLMSGYENENNFDQSYVKGEPIRYVDWLVPGIIGMNMLFSCLFGVGFVIIRYRKNGVLKRLKATPVSALSFVNAQMVSRFFIVLATSFFVYGGTNLFLGFMMKGSYLDLIIITSLGILCMISLGLVFASRIKSEELGGGLINIITFPMIIFSGVFFSLEGTPVILQNVAKAFPLTHFIDGARKIMLEGASLWEIGPNVLTLAAMTLVFLLLSSFMFKWES